MALSDIWDVKAHEEWVKQARAAAPPDADIILPQPGFQFAFMNTPADVCFGGGGAGGGKTYALLMEAGRWHKVPNYGGTIFRRLTTELRRTGGLWDEAQNMYGTTIGGKGRSSPEHVWTFPQVKGGLAPKVTFSHLQHEDDMYSHHGGQYPFVGFDELPTFLESQFWYLFSRCRTKLPIKPYVRATGNPQSDGWVKDLVEWWLWPDNHPDPDKAGYPREDRIGKLRWFVRDDDKMVWGDTPMDVLRQEPAPLLVDDGIDVRHKIKSFTFLPGGLFGNKALLKADPSYVGNLLAQNVDERNRLLYGCWKYIEGGDDLFNYNGLLDMQYNDFIPRGRQRYITADIALEGSDLFVVMVWQGYRVKRVYTYERSPGPAIVHAIKNIANEWGVRQSNIIYDRDGVGGFLQGYLPAARGFRANAAAMPRLRRKGAKGENYENLKTQCAYMAAEAVEAAEVYVEPGAMHDWQWDRLVGDCRAHLKRDTELQGKLKMSRKKEVTRRLKRSPDLADAFFMRWAFDLMWVGGSVTM